MLVVARNWTVNEWRFGRIREHDGSGWWCFGPIALGWF
jgi:hypothetical protein